MKEEEKELYMVYTDEGVWFLDDEDNIWRDGSRSLVFFPVFTDKNLARKYADRVKRRLKTKWTGVRKVRIIG